MLERAYSSATTNNLKISDLVYSGRYNPPVTGSILNSFYWKGIGLSFNITYKLNYYFRRPSINYNILSGTNGWQQAGFNDYVLRWQQPGDEAKTNVPSIAYPFNATRELFYTQSSVLIEKGDHIRLQYINLSYDLDNRIIRKWPVQHLKFYFYANNLGILWRANNKGIDPDYPYIAYPPMKTYSVGIKANF